MILMNEAAAVFHFVVIISTFNPIDYNDNNKCCLNWYSILFRLEQTVLIETVPVQVHTCRHLSFAF